MCVFVSSCLLCFFFAFLVLQQIEFSANSIARAMENGRFLIGSQKMFHTKGACLLVDYRWGGSQNLWASLYRTVLTALYLNVKISRFRVAVSGLLNCVRMFIFMKSGASAFWALQRMTVSTIVLLRTSEDCHWFEGSQYAGFMIQLFFHGAPVTRL